MAHVVRPAVGKKSFLEWRGARIARVNIAGKSRGGRALSLPPRRFFAASRCHAGSSDECVKTAIILTRKEEEEQLRRRRKPRNASRNGGIVSQSVSQSAGSRSLGRSSSHRFSSDPLWCRRTTNLTDRKIRDCFFVPLPFETSEWHVRPFSSLLLPIHIQHTIHNLSTFPGPF